MNDKITFEQADAAVDFIKKNAKKFGVMVGHCKGLEHTRGVVKKQGQLDSQKSTVADREADGETSAEYKAVIEDIEDAWAERTTLETLMKAAEMTFDLYRSSNKWGGP